MKDRMKANGMVVGGQHGVPKDKARIRAKKDHHRWMRERRRVLHSKREKSDAQSKL